MFKKTRNRIAQWYVQAKMKRITGDAAYKLIQVNPTSPETDNTTQYAFGISYERYEELKDKCHKAFHKFDSISEAMIEVQGEFKHANEFAFIYYIFHELKVEHGGASMGGGI